MGQCNAIPDCSAQNDGGQYEDESSGADEPVHETGSWSAKHGTHAIKESHVPDKDPVEADAILPPRAQNINKTPVDPRRQGPPPSAVATKTFEKSPYAANMASRVPGAGGFRVSEAEDAQDAQDREAGAQPQKPPATLGVLRVNTNPNAWHSPDANTPPSTIPRQLRSAWGTGHGLGPGLPADSTTLLPASPVWSEQVCATPQKLFDPGPARAVCMILYTARTVQHTLAHPVARRYRGEDGEFLFKLDWSTEATQHCTGINSNTWRQTSNPVTEEGPPTGYEPLSVAHTERGFGGLQYNMKTCLLDGSIGLPGDIDVCIRHINDNK